MPQATPPDDTSGPAPQNLRDNLPESSESAEFQERSVAFDCQSQSVTHCTSLDLSQVSSSQICSSQVEPIFCNAEVVSQWQGGKLDPCTVSGVEIRKASFELVYGRPLRVVHVGSILFQAGIEVWLKSLIRNACPRRLRFTRCVVTSSHYDPDVLNGLGVPVDVGTGELGVQRAARNCDVMLISGPPEVGDWLKDVRPPLCIGIAHGEGHGTRKVLEGCGEILDHTIAVSRGVSETACQGFNTTMIHNGIDPVHLACSRSRIQCRTSLGFREGDFVVGSVCRFSPEKRPERLVEAIAMLPERFKLLLVGWGPMYESLRYLADRVAPGRVSILQAKENLGDCYQAMDAFSLVSDSEGYGLAIMEAMFSRLPIIVTSVGFVPEMINDRINGVIVDGSSNQIAKTVSLIARHPHWAAGLAREARETAERYGFAREMANKYEDLIHELWQAKAHS